MNEDEVTETSSTVFQEAERMTATVARDVRMEAAEPEVVYEQHIPHGLETTVEFLSRDCFAQKDISFSTCEKVVQLVCGLAKSLRKRSFQEGTESIALGAYSHGNYYGIIKKTYGLQQTTKYINAFMKHHGAKGQWSSFQLCHNCHVGCHRDAHNLVGTPCWTISFGNFSKGRLWLESSSPAQATTTNTLEKVKLSDGTEALGEVVSTRQVMTQFCPKTRHAVEEWEGDRFSIVAYTTRGIQELSRTERDVLRTFGFPLGKSEGTSHADREFNQRPKKSVRRTLWKGAQRASAFLTLGLAAASSFLSEQMPSGKLPGQACLFEIGGTEITYQYVEAGAHVVEPLSWDEYNDPDRTIDVNLTIKNLKPNVVWFQGSANSSFLGETVQRTIECQLDCGGCVVLQAQLQDPLWTSAALGDLVNQYAHSCEDCGDLRLLRLGQPGPPECEHHQDVGLHVHQEFMTSREQQKPVDQEGGSAIRFDGNVPPHVQVALKRLHQNLGHPRIVDMLRHLRYAGADEGVLKACKKMRCEVCDRNQKTQVARPATLPSLLDMNQLVSIDVFHAFDVDRVRHEFLSVIDHATTFHLVCELQGHSTEAFCRGFTQLWGNVFGAPGTISTDLETGLQAGITKYAEFHGSKLRTSAGQAHWQQGVIERHGLWYQEILQRVIDEKSITSEDMHLAVQAVNSAKNELRRRHGFSPTQAVFGRDPRCPEELCGSNDEERFIEVMSSDSRRQREVSIRTAAKMAFFRTQLDSKFRKALIQRSRVKRGGYAVGEMVSFYRMEKVATKRGSWRGPGTIVGTEGGNWWVSFGGRCHLVAEEHLRPSSPEEVGDILSSKIARDDLEKLLNLDPDDPSTYEQVDEPEPPEEAPSPDQDPEQDFQVLSDEEMVEDMDFTLELEGADPVDGIDGSDRASASERRQLEHPAPYGPVRKRVRQKGPQGQEHTVHMMKKCQTDRALEKALEKEIPWKLIPESEHADFKLAEEKQFREHLDHQALKPLSVDESAEVMRRVDPSRILTSRFAYRDKHWSRRKLDPGLAWKHKARLVVSGHRDPDVKCLETDAPTINRLTILTLLQVLASRKRTHDWVAAAGDITAAFLNGDDMDRELYLRQPRTGLKGLDPRQLLLITKGVFGLPDSPRKWWKRLRRDMLNIRIEVEGQECFFTQCPLDPCLFQLVSAEDPVCRGSC